MNSIAKAAVLACCVLAVASGVRLPSLENEAQAAELAYPGQFPSLQATIDAAGRADTIAVGAGVFPEAAHIPAGKRLTLVGAGRDATLFDGSNISGPLFTLDGDSKLRLRDLSLVSGDDAVSVLPPPNSLDTPASLDMRDVVATSGARGVVGHIKRLRIRNSVIDAATRGLAIRSPRVVLKDLVVNADDVGVLIDNSVEGACVVALSGLEVHGGGSGGIVIFGGKTAVSLRDSFVGEAGTVGIALFQVASADLLRVSIHDTSARPSDSLFGDGLFVWASKASLRFSEVVGSARAGLSAFGCNSTLETAKIDVDRSVLLCNGLDLDLESISLLLPGSACGAGSIISTLNLPGNSCSSDVDPSCASAGVHECQVVSASLASVPPPSP